MMKLVVNGEYREVAAETLAALLIELEYEGNWLATAINGEIVHAGQRSAWLLAEGDRIEILSPMKGG